MDELVGDERVTEDLGSTAITYGSTRDSCPMKDDPLWIM